MHARHSFSDPLSLSPIGGDDGAADGVPILVALRCCRRSFGLGGTDRAVSGVRLDDEICVLSSSSIRRKRGSKIGSILISIF